MRLKSEDEGGASRPRRSAVQVKKKVDKLWVFKILLTAVIISVGLTLASSEILSNAGYLLAFLVLAVFIFIGIFFDIIGTSVTSADEAPFHSMASHKVRGGVEAIRLIKNAEKVASICNDVVGDIAGIVSGTSAAIIVSRLVEDSSIGNVIMQLAMSGVVAGLTIGGKAVGKTFAINKNTKIVHFTARLISYKNDLFLKFRRNKGSRT